MPASETAWPYVLAMPCASISLCTFRSILNAGLWKGWCPGGSYIKSRGRLGAAAGIFRDVPWMTLRATNRFTVLKFRPKRFYGIGLRRCPCGIRNNAQRARTFKNTSRVSKNTKRLDLMLKFWRPSWLPQLLRGGGRCEW